jgi:iron complex transport system substrate-binding protein
MRISRFLAAIAALSLSALSASAMDVVTARGTVAVDGTPKSVAVYDIAAIDTLARLGVQLAGIPEKLFLPELGPVKQGATVVGTLFEPDLEALSALGPDLIIVGGRSSTKADATAKVAPTIDMTIDGDTLVDQAKQRLATYGELFGKTAEAKAAAEALDAKLASAKAAVAGKGKALIIMTNGPKVSVYGPGSRFGWVHASLDLPAAVTETEAATHGEAVSFEFIRQANPDWLLVLDRAAAIGSSEQGAKVTLDNELVAETTAWKKGQVIYLPAPDFYIAAGGVQSLERVLATITEAFAAAK